MHFFSQFLIEQHYHTLPRKQALLSSKTLIYGPPKSGKTSLALDFAHNSQIPSKKIVFMDCQDPRICEKEAKSELLKLYLERKIELLILKGFAADFSLPNIEHILLISNQKMQIPSFSSHQCSYLSFIEYVSFCSKNNSLDSLLKNFIKDGNLPQMPFLSEHQKIRTKQEILKLNLKDNLPLFTQLLPFQAQKLTSFQFYTMLKKTHKISKDRVYAFIDGLEREGLIFFLPHLLPNKPKKIYFSDFSLPKALSLHHTIVPLLENMFVLELLALSKEVYYDDFGCFILPNIGKFLFAPFAQRDFIEKKLSKMPKENLRIITLDFSDSGLSHAIQWEALSFAEFTLGGIE